MIDIVNLPHKRQWGKQIKYKKLNVRDNVYQALKEYGEQTHQPMSRLTETAIRRLDRSIATRINQLDKETKQRERRKESTQDSEPTPSAS